MSSEPNRRRDESLHILQHALGIDEYGRGESSRNHFTSNENCDNWMMLMAHVHAGRMVVHEAREIFGGDCCFVVTDAGREYVRQHSQEPPKLSASQRRYRQWLAADCGMSFGEWLRHGH